MRRYEMGASVVLVLLKCVVPAREARVCCVCDACVTRLAFKFKTKISIKTWMKGNLVPVVVHSQATRETTCSDCGHVGGGRGGCDNMTCMPVHRAEG